MDCTGHGVPGAFMSLIGNTFLNQIVNEYRIFAPELILRNLHRSIQKALRQKETQNWDGMDIALLRLNRQEKLAHFAGAKNPLVYVQNGQLHVIKGDKFSIGGNFIKDARFKSHTISLQGDEVFYLFSDGFQDQFGGEIGRKFTVGRFHDLLFKLHPFAPQDQQIHLIQSLEAWQQNEEQVDDLLVIGFKA
ncbi:MAG: SpoIIE family protein phosphatase [Microscillaceae bacterium]|nr:SpoIIE family protein phosphatase [Microscillaceae bacterium]